MGIYLNPNNTGFLQSVRSKIYVDKTGMIAYTNDCLNTRDKFICVSRPRRFGKSMTLDMLSAYYSSGCSSEKLFLGYKAAKDNSFYEHLNRYDVLFLNMQKFLNRAKQQEMIAYLEKTVIAELKEMYGNFFPEYETDLAAVLEHIYAKTETYEALKIYIDMNYDGLREAVISLLGEACIEVNTRTFQNDMRTFKTKDDVLTLLIHLGYLAYNQETHKVFIPNKEIVEEFESAMSVSDWKDVMHVLKASDRLLEDTL